MLVTVSGTFAVNGSGDLDAQTDRVMDALLLIEGEDPTISDSDIDAELADRRVRVAVVVEADSFDAADARGREIIRRAITMANGQVSGHAPSFLTEAQSAELLPA